MRGIDITLYDKVKTGDDPFGHPTYAETPVVVENVLVGEPTGEEITDILNLYGKHVVYTLAIPKGDTHTWTDRKIEFFGEAWKAIVLPVSSIENLIPLDWNKTIQVERYA
jgi:hypothetical protein